MITEYVILTEILSVEPNIQHYTIISGDSATKFFSTAQLCKYTFELLY